jgi:predicted dehydrogenase/threonine dehydrogenase-like Zn-dependent dehydrogenase
MRQVLLHKGSIKIKEVFEPLLNDTSVLVSVHYSCISSGTENAMISSNKKNILFSNLSQKITKVFESIQANGIEGTRALIKSKISGEYQSLGYACSGVVIAVGKQVKNFRPGDYVACAGAQLAMHADTVCIPTNLVVKIRNPQNVKIASLTTITAIALQGLRRANIQLGETVSVLGLGLLGQITVQLLKNNGCKVIGIDINSERLTLAQELGADATYHAHDPSLYKEIEYLTEFYGCDATIITAGSSSNSIIQQAMEVTRKKGKVVIVGDIGLEINRSPFYQKEIDLLISCSYGPGRYDQSYERDNIDYPYAYVRWTENRNMATALALIEEGKISTNKLIPLELSVDQASLGYKELEKGSQLGVVLSYVPKKDLLSSEQERQKNIHFSSHITYIPPLEGNIRVALIGAGGFAKVKLLPLLSKINNVTLSAIVDADMINALNVAKLYPDAIATTHEQDIFQNNSIDVVIIASPHKFHCDQALQALVKGKAVFVEKPMVTDFKQLERLHSFLSTHTTIPFCVDYNRSFAPFIVKIKKELQKRKTPLMAYYRMNAGYIPKDHWVQTATGAGRIIGEACHIFELFCFLTDAEPRTISVETVAPANENLFPTDNFSAQIHFSDGSVCTLLYTALGHAKLAKERMELFFDSKSIVMDDYKVLQGYGTSLFFDQKTKYQDKGHEALIREFFKDVAKTNSSGVISHKRLYDAAHITLIIDKLACQGGGSFDIVNDYMIGSAGQNKNQDIHNSQI